MNIYQLFSDKNNKKYPPLVFTKHDKKKFKELNDKGYGIFFAVNDFNKSRKEKDLKALRYIYADIDIAKNGDGQTREDKELAKEKKINNLLEYCSPTKIIDTSNGIQPLWKLKGGLNPTEENIKRYKKVLLGIINAFEADSGAKDVSRVLRMPGYYHQKAEPYLCKLIHDYPEREYTLEELEEKFPYEEPEVKKPVVHNNNTQVDSLDFKEVVKRCFKEKGVSISFSNSNNLCLSGAENDPTSAYIDRNNHSFLHHGDSTRLKDMGLAFSGNVVTLPADMLFNGNRADAFKWLKKEFNLLDEQIQKQLDEIEEFKENRDDGKRYTWGTRELNIHFGVIKSHHFAIIGAKRFSGKTTFTFDMARKNAELGHKILYISLEMDTEEILNDFARKYSGITIQEEFDKNIPEIKQKAFEKRKRELDGIENLIFKGIRKTGNVRWDIIKALIKKYKDVDMIFIDNLDLIANNIGENDWEKQKRVSGEMMSFTSEKRIPIFLIHHYRKTTGKGHGMDELSGSGKIADNADIIVKISRNKDPEAEYPEKYKSVVHLQKFRGYIEYTSEIYFIKGEFVDEPPDEKAKTMEDAINLIN